MKKVSLRVFGILGTGLFVPLCLFTFSDPQSIEHAGESFIEWRLHSDTAEKIDSQVLPKPTQLETMLGAIGQAADLAPC